ncbi:cold shock domain-containing protein [Pedobacter sp.]|jgi:CspA family cold shock protein|uniref:cold-shock protein n=1 Tax=Pedobacter sp. TaxID=1411316 RepID=UPI002D7F5413|nr:cold shock domain-containing protein [Pedobacter sp.]
MLQGTVKWFSESKGFGFITSNNKEYFVHYKEINSDGFKTLEPGEPVSFEPANSPKGAIAKNVQRT